MQETRCAGCALCGAQGKLILGLWRGGNAQRYHFFVYLLQSRVYLYAETENFASEVLSLLIEIQHVHSTCLEQSRPFCPGEVKGPAICR